ncbi:MAG TPA: hydantoinase/oxoprolinase family protein [Baekduia sp.]|nr:hydantoinase/oxoprolinase family protein [Baekduia sp.]
MLLGVDVGGTFTDAVLVDGGRVVTAKAATTPADQSEGVMAAVELALRAADREAADVRGFAHGMTVATNALLEGRGARTAFVATEGFTDLLELGRQARPELYRLCVAAPPPLAPAQRRVGVPERCGPEGVRRALTREAARQVAEDVAALEPEAVAVCLLHGYRHTAHEQLLGEVLRERLGDQVHISLSHDVTATFREVERAATTEVDAALSPLLAAYLRSLERRARGTGLPAPAIMQSSGGLTSDEIAARHAALTVLSGPAGGAAAAALLSERLGEPDLLCFDMGGTSCDVCVVQDGRVRETGGREIAGRPLALPMVDIHTVGAGGGSIAWRDPGGALRVGPRSAGADPGPACYGRGGTEPAVTDAHVVLGHLGGTLSGVELDEAAAREAVGRLAGRLGLGTEECAAGILRVADAEMVRALRVMTVQRGLDPRDFALLAFGGAGPLHAASMADELGISRVVVPAASGVLSALGLAAADWRADAQRTVLLRGDALTDAALRQVAGEVGALAARTLARDDARREITWEVRYAGQSHELAVRTPPDAAAVREAFAAEHERRYGYRDADTEVEVVTVRVRASVPGAQLTWEAQAGERVAGPRSVALPGSTVWLPEGWSAQADATGTLRLERTA